MGVFLGTSPVLILWGWGCATGSKIFAPGNDVSSQLRCVKWNALLAIAARARNRRPMLQIVAPLPLHESMRWPRGCVEREVTSNESKYEKCKHCPAHRARWCPTLVQPCSASLCCTPPAAVECTCPPDGSSIKRHITGGGIRLFSTPNPRPLIACVLRAASDQMAACIAGARICIACHMPGLPPRRAAVTYSTHRAVHAFGHRSGAAVFRAPRMVSAPSCWLLPVLLLAPVHGDAVFSAMQPGSQVNGKKRQAMHVPGNRRPKAASCPG